MNKLTVANGGIAAGLRFEAYPAMIKVDSVGPSSVSYSLDSKKGRTSHRDFEALFHEPLKRLGEVYRDLGVGVFVQ